MSTSSISQSNVSNNRITKIINIQAALYFALALALAGSLNHMAHTFASVDKNIFMGWVQALAVDVGLLAIAYSINKRKAQKRSTKMLWVGVVLFTGISAFGNFDYAIAQGGISYFKAVVLSAILPLLVLYLAEVVSDNNQYTQKQIAKQVTKKPSKTLQNTDIANNLQEQKQQKRNERKEKALQLWADGQTDLQVIANSIGVKDIRTVRSYINGKVTS